MLYEMVRVFGTRMGMLLSFFKILRSHNHLPNGLFRSSPLAARRGNRAREEGRQSIKFKYDHYKEDNLFTRGKY